MNDLNCRTKHNRPTFRIVKLFRTERIETEMFLLMVKKAAH